MIRNGKSANRPGLGIQRTSSANGNDAVLDVTVVLLEAGYASTAIGPIEVFHSTGVLWNALHGEAPQPRFRVRIASIDGASVTSLCSLGLTPELAIDDIDQTDIIIVSSTGLEVQDWIARNPTLLPWLRKWHSRGAYIAGICTGVAFLAESGLLDGRQATTHWAVADILRQRYPKVVWRPEQFVTEDGRVLCSGGVYASIDLSLYLVEKFCGHETALQCAKSLLLSMPRNRQSGYSVLPLSRPHSDEKIRQTEEYLQHHFDPRRVDRHPRRAHRHEPAQLHPPLQGRDRPPAGGVHPDPCACPPPRSCWSTALRRSRPSARRSATRTSRSSGACSSATPE